MFRLALLCRVACVVTFLLGQHGASQLVPASQQEIRASEYGSLEALQKSCADRCTVLAEAPQTWNLSQGQTFHIPPQMHLRFTPAVVRYRVDYPTCMDSQCRHREDNGLTQRPASANQGQHGHDVHQRAECRNLHRHSTARRRPCGLLRFRFNHHHGHMGRDGLFGRRAVAPHVSKKKLSAG